MKRRAMLQTLIAAGAVSFGQESDFTLRSDVRLVLLDVAVKDRKGRPVAGLAKDNFSVYEDGRKQTLTVFTHDDLPVTIGILVDSSSSMRPIRVQVLAAADVFITESNPHDEVFVLNFNDRVTRGLPANTLFSDNRDQLREALRRVIPQGKTALNDAVVDALEQLKKGRREKKALIVISDGGDNASAHSRRDTLALVQRSTATIYCIGIYEEDNLERDSAFLSLLANISGGETYFPKSPEALTSICRRIAHDIRARYTVGYIPTAFPGAKTLRHITVRVSAPEKGKLIARTRTSYSYET